VDDVQILSQIIFYYGNNRNHYICHYFKIEIMKYALLSIVFTFLSLVQKEKEVDYVAQMKKKLLLCSQK
jgi:hypothetical protein